MHSKADNCKMHKKLKQVVNNTVDSILEVTCCSEASDPTMQVIGGLFPKQREL